MTTGDAVRLEATREELRVARPTWGLALSVLWQLCFGAALLAYGVALGSTARLWWLFVAIVVLFFGGQAVACVAVLVAQLGGPPAALTADGVRLRPRPTRRRVVTLPWAEVVVVWVGHVGFRRYLCVQADPRGAHADEWDPRRRRFERRGGPLAIYLPRSVSVDDVRAAVAGLSGGAVTLADRGPDPEFGDGRRRRIAMRDERRPARTVVSLLVLVVVAVIGIPLLLGVAPPWGQPWWPGVTAAADFPDACGVFGDAAAGTLHISGRQRVADSARLHKCEFTVPQGQLTVQLERFTSLFGGGTGKAADRAEELRAAMGSHTRRLADLGDEAWLDANAQGTTNYLDRSVVNLVARRADVVLLIVYGGEQEPDAAQGAVLDTARTTLAGLHAG